MLRQQVKTADECKRPIDRRSARRLLGEQATDPRTDAVMAGQPSEYLRLDAEESVETHGLGSELLRVTFHLVRQHGEGAGAGARRFGAPLPSPHP